MNETSSSENRNHVKKLERSTCYASQLAQIIHDIGRTAAREHAIHSSEHNPCKAIQHEYTDDSLHDMHDS